ncbi:unnamed protein product [Cyprideis torosa]|uniref:WD repeat, SAM and U-box domain-containing protein 1 n=1 Tax=Cyprideis torosa TaxID=163714 RepID=A0A7R8WGI7_9CRUS|nr:unnamed protein product [Cyprideis torosa]CAG0891787.1 unnamed protein product [Cyprideis torosa]
MSERTNKEKQPVTKMKTEEVLEEDFKKGADQRSSGPGPIRKSGEQLSIYHQPGGNSVRCCCFSPSGRYLASCSDDGKICIWNTSDHKVVKFLDIEDSEASAETVAFTPDGSYIVVGTSTGRMLAFEAQSSRHINPLFVYSEAHDLGVTTVDVSSKPLAASVATPTYYVATGGQDALVRLWKMSVAASCTTLRSVKSLTGHSTSVMCVKFNPSGSLLASASGDKTVRLWNAETGACVSVLQGHGRYVTSVSFSIDGKWLASGSNDRTVRIWKVNDGPQDEAALLDLSPPAPRLSQPVSAWNVQDVCDWIEDLGLETFRNRFQEEGIDGRQILTMTDERLQALGIEDSDQRRRVLQEASRVARQAMMSKAEEGFLPVEFFCPITHSIMSDPVVAEDGYSYERSALLHWLTQKPRSPLTNKPIGVAVLPNRTLKALIQRHLLMPSAPPV